MRIPEHKNFLEELQSLDRTMKRNVLFAGTLIVMVIVVYFWLAYFNNLVTTLGAPALAQTTNAAANGPLGGTTAPAPTAVAPTAATPTASDSSPTVWQNVTGGTAFIFREFQGAMGDIAHLFRSPGEYNVRPK